MFYNAVDCPVGFTAIFSNGGESESQPTCEQCSVGTFKNITGNSDCMPCPAGVNGFLGQTTTARNGSTSVNDCIIGIYYNYYVSNF